MKLKYTNILKPLVAVVLATVVSCAKPLVIEEPEIHEGEDPAVEVVFSLAGNADVKATDISSSNEEAVNRWAVFVFQNGGTWYRYATSSSASNIPMTLRAGETYSIYAVVNYPLTGTGAFNPATVDDPSDITSKVAYLSDNATNSIIMYGYDTITPSATFYDPEDPSTAVTVEKEILVRRIVSRIDVPAVAVDFSAKPWLASKTFTLRHIYVTNAYRTSTYSADYTTTQLSASRSAWYNTGGWHRGEAAESSMDALLQDRNINAVIVAGNPYSVPHSFYAFPNAMLVSADDHQTGTWTKRCTRIILEATIDSDTYYYQINVPGMSRNRIYSANNIVIRGLGSNDPEVIDIDPDVVSATFTVDPLGWDGPFNVTEES